MKNWKYINGAEIGNRDVSTSHLKDIEEQIKNWEHALQEVDGINKENAKKILEGLRKERQQIRDNVGNSSVEEQNEKLFHSLKKDVEEKEEDNDEKIEEVGNSKTGNANYRYKGYLITKSDEDGEIIVFKPNGRDVAYRGTKSEDMAKDWIDHHSTGSKTGNARYTSRADVISHLDTDLYDICKKVPAGSPSVAYVRELQKTGWDIATISKYNKEIGQIIDKYAKTGNKTGNADTDAKFAELYKSQEWAKLSDPQQKKIQLMAWLRQGKISSDEFAREARKIGNNIENGLARARNAMACNKKDPEGLKKKIDDYAGQGLSYDDVISNLVRFGYDKADIEAQASYIKKKVGNSIYSELNKSDKRVVIEADGSWYVYDKNDKIVEQGHESNADNALGKFKAKGYNKKTIGNKEVTLWSGNDSVLISDDGTVKYLENNSFETDRDKYDSQQKAIEEMTKKGYRKK